MLAILRRTIALLLVLLALGISSCGGNRDVPVVLLADEETGQKNSNSLTGAIAEVSPPERIQQLKPYLDVYEPQARIATPNDGETLSDTTVEVTLQIRDFPIYKDQTLEFGPHLHLFLDNRPHQAIYDVDAPIILDNLAPGTHTLRLLVVRPWGESFKNEGAYDQVTFNVFAASPQNNPDDSQPLLTYNQPQDRYGAEPILLDFYLNNAPLHLVAETDENIADWRIRCTVNGESFVFDRWQPLYLQGFRPGKNWVKLELVDENGNLIDNALNTSIRVIDYEPEGSDGLSRLVRGEIPLEQAKVLIDPNYKPASLSTESPVEAVEEPAEDELEQATPEVQTLEETAPSVDASDSPPSTLTEPDADIDVEPASEPDEGESSTPNIGDETESKAELETKSFSTTPETPAEQSVTAPAVIDSEPDMAPSDAAETDVPLNTPALDPTVERPVVEPSTGDRQSDAPFEADESAVKSSPENLLERPDNLNREATELQGQLESADEQPPEPLTGASPSGDSLEIAPDDDAVKDEADAAINNDAISTESKFVPEEDSAANPVPTFESEASDEDINEPIAAPGEIAEPDADTAPETNLKTLEDNADII